MLNHFIQYKWILASLMLMHVASFIFLAYQQPSTKTDKIHILSFTSSDILKGRFYFLHYGKVVEANKNIEENR